MSDISDHLLHDLLTTSRSFVSVGMSANPIRPSYFVGRYLSRKGFTIIPVNPAYRDQQLFGERIVGEIEAIDPQRTVDIIDIFRRSEDVPDIVSRSIAHFRHLKAIWMQVGVRHADAARYAEGCGLTVIQDRCPKIEYQRLFGELRMAGFNTGVISSRLHRHR